jgi:ribosomal protein L2
MPRPLPPGGQRRRAVPLRLSLEEEAPVQAVADIEHDGNLSAAIRALLAEAIAARTIRALQGINDQEK